METEGKHQVIEGIPTCTLEYVFTRDHSQSRFEWWPSTRKLHLDNLCPRSTLGTFFPRCPLQSSSCELISMLGDWDTESILFLLGNLTLSWRCWFSPTLFSFFLPTRTIILRSTSFYYYNIWYYDFNDDLCHIAYLPQSMTISISNRIASKLCQIHFSLSTEICIDTGDTQNGPP